MQHRFARASLVLLALVVAAGVSPPVGSAQAPARPNIVFIMADDLDHRVMESLFAANLPPHLRALRDGGTDFTQTFVSVPLCCPDRASFLRGQYKHNHGVTSNEDGWPKFLASGYEDAAAPDPRNVGIAMQRAGYGTALIGKYLNGYDGELIAGTKGQPGTVYRVPGGWDHWRAALVSAQPPRNNDYYDFMTIENDPNQPTAVERLYPKSVENYQVDVLARQAREAFAAIRREGKPAFLFIAPKAPHNSIAAADPQFGIEPGFPTPAVRHLTTPVPKTRPRSAAFDEADVSDKPPAIQALPRLSENQILKLDKMHRRQQRAMLAVDDLVRDLTETVRSEGQLANTYVFFTSDNGWHGGEHRLAEEKHSQYEESIRIPHYASGPGIAVQTRSELLSMNDFFPTFVALAGGTAPSYVDGRSFVPLLGGQALAWRKRLLVESSGQDVFSVLRRRTFAYVQHYRSDGGLSFEESYNTRTDPAQANNLQSRLVPAVVEDNRYHLARLRECKQAPDSNPANTCRAREDEK